MTRLVRLALVLVALVATTSTRPLAQPLVSPPIVTPSQRALWDRERAENHPYFVQACAEGLKDTTTAERYGSRARWSALCRIMGGPVDMAQRSYTVTKRIAKDWTPGSLGTSNELREHAVEHVVTLTWVAPDLTSTQIQEWKTWLISNADAAMAANLRLNDSDQTTGTLMFWCVMDRAFGTDYCTRPKAIDAYNAVKGFIARAEGGGYVDFGDYDWGTLYLLFNGAEVAGLEKFPDVAAFRSQVAKAVIQWSTPDLRDTFELGDDQSPNSVPPHGREDLLAYLGHYHPEVRSFELELRQVLNWPDGTPMYSRYITWANPFAPATQWRAFVGTWLVNPGLGKAYYKTGWTPQDCGLLAYVPPLSTGLGGIDHVYGWFGHFRLRCDGQWVVDSPIGYSANVQLANQTVLAGLPAAGEIGVLTAAQRVGALVYVSGTNAGLNVNSGYYNPPATYRYELTPSLYYVPAWRALAKVERIHLDDPKVQTVTPTSTTLSLTRFSTALQTTIKSYPLIRSFWHSQTTEPTVQEGVIVGDARVRPLYPATFAVVNMAGGSYGTLADREKKWFVTVDPVNQAPGFRVLTTLVGDVSGTVEPLGAVQRLRLRKAGAGDIIIYSSTTPGPVLMTTRSGSSSTYDRAKVEGILAARRVTVDPAWAELGADVYVEQPDGLVQLTPAPAPPTTTSPAQQLIQQIRDALEQLGAIVK